MKTAQLNHDERKKKKCKQGTRQTILKNDCSKHVKNTILKIFIIQKLTPKYMSEFPLIIMKISRY